MAQEELDETVMWAAENGLLSLLKAAVERGGDITVEDHHATMWAAENGHLECLKFCVERGGEVTALNHAATMWAAENGHLECLKFCIEQGGDEARKAVETVVGKKTVKELLNE